MARPSKQTVEYFPHFVTSGQTMFILESEYKNDGYAAWFKILEILGSTEGHAIKADSPLSWKYLVAKLNMDSDKARSILDTLADLEAIDRELWQKHKIIWSQNFVNNLTEAYRKRTVSAPQRPDPDGTSDGNPPAEEKPPEAAPETPPEPPKEKKPRKKKEAAAETEPKEVKEAYGDFVKMTKAEHDKLTEEYGPDLTKKMITTLNDYKGSTGKTYKSDYHAIRSFIRRDEERAKENKTKAGNKPVGGKNSTFNNFDHRDYDYDDLEKKLLGWDK